MELYHVQFVDFEAINLFATNITQARFSVDIYLSFNFAENAEYQICHSSELPHSGATEFYQLQAAAAMTTAGCGVYENQSGWTIVPLWQHPLLPKFGSERRLRSSLTLAVSEKP